MSKLSVCIAAYNGEKYIEEQLVSILDQLTSTDEVIVSDDGSSDGTIAILDKIDDPRVKIFSNNSGKHGVVPNFENAIKHASGDVIFLSDQDDVWLPNKVSMVLKRLQNCDFVIHNASITDSSGTPNGEDYFSLRKSRYGYIQNIIKMGYLGCCMAFKRDCLKFILPFPKHILWHDMWIAAILHLFYRGIMMDESLILYRRHGDNASPTTEKSGYSLFFRLKYRLYILIFSLLRIFNFFHIKRK